MLFVAVGGALALVILFLGVMTYNGLVGKRNRVRNAWSQIDVQLKRRHDLIPNLVNAVRGYMAHERGTLETIANARRMVTQAGNDIGQRAAAEQQLGQAVRGLFVLAEAYPQLKADATMQGLQEELATTENRIAFARQFYNDAVTEYNSSRERFPSALFAGPLGFQPATLFLIDDAAERAVPQVQF